MQNATPNAQGNALQAWLAAGLPLTLLSPALDLPAEVVQLILIHIPTHYIALLAPTCRALSVAARNAQRANRHWFSGTIVTLGGYTHVTMLNAVCHVECDSCYDDDDDDDDEYYDEYYDGRRLFCSCGATSCGRCAADGSWPGWFKYPGLLGVLDNWDTCPRCRLAAREHGDDLSIWRASFGDDDEDAEDAEDEDAEDEDAEDEDAEEWAAEIVRAQNAAWRSPHEHAFLPDETYNEATDEWTKRCACGFEVTYERC